MERMYEMAKADLGVVPQTLNNSNVTGRYYAAKDYRRALAVLQVGALAVTKTAKIEVFEAKDAAGTSAQLISGATATITANASVTEMTVALATVLANDAITINGLTFTAVATLSTAPITQIFNIDGDNTADAVGLAACINDATYGVPGVTASASAGTITLKATDPGETTITASSAASTFTIATTQAEAYVEVDGLGLSATYTHVGCKITSTGNGIVGALLMRGNARGAITQRVGASAVV
ncbi:MAG: hypothetical protein HQ465_00290 [Rhodospirillales bacterium]|nr:hypothetical protein [Rhodospirillales bacterium]